MNFRAEQFIRIDFSFGLENFSVEEQARSNYAVFDLMLGDNFFDAEQGFEFVLDFGDDFGRFEFHQQPPSGTM